MKQYKIYFHNSEGNPPEERKTLWVSHSWQKNVVRNAGYPLNRYHTIIDGETALIYKLKYKGLIFHELHAELPDHI